MNTPTQNLLRSIKEQTGWSEPRIASEINTSQATVNRLLHGQPGCQVGTYLAIEALAARLRIIPKRQKRRSQEDAGPAPS
jgi:transcriptional regulator with XRE-family HTH domain